jgi:hypothetical protein
MLSLAHVDANEPNPVYLATSDYSLVAEVALGIGRPIPTPRRPALAAKDTFGGTGSHTTLSQHPSFVGVYDDPNASIRVLDENSVLIGGANIDKQGRYSVGIGPALSPGVHTIRVQADDSGLFSNPSLPYSFRVLVRPHSAATASHPQGPLALK